jgi:hypothetical protein
MVLKTAKIANVIETAEKVGVSLRLSNVQRCKGHRR